MAKKINFGKIDNIILFGGSPLLAEFSIFLKKSEKYSVICFTCKRQLDEVIGKKGETLRNVLQRENISFYSSEDVCKDKRLHSSITDTTLGLGFGEVWSFDKKTIDKFRGKLLDFMGIPLPQYRGGAHYSWLIMKRDKTWGCNLQVINEKMVQGVFDSGGIVKSKKYSFPDTVKIPQDYFDAAVKYEIVFLKKFLREIELGKQFKPYKIREKCSIYFPRLFTAKHGFVDWKWKTEDIVTFIRAFDSPYKGASTFLDNKRVFLKECSAGFDDGSFHPFQVGLIYRKYKKSLFIATVDGTVIVKKITDESGRDLINSVKVGQRLFTPAEKLAESMQYSAVYGSKGIVKK